MMKTLILTGILFATSGAFAADDFFSGEEAPRGHKHPPIGVSVVGGENAQAIFEALDVEGTEVEGPRGNTVIMKKAGTLKCFQGEAGETTRTMCRLVGKKVKPHCSKHPRKPGPRCPKHPRTPKP